MCWFALDFFSFFRILPCAYVSVGDDPQSQRNMANAYFFPPSSLVLTGYDANTDIFFRILSRASRLWSSKPTWTNTDIFFFSHPLLCLQVMILKANMGERDFVMHAMGLFIDFVAIFVRIMIILAKNSGNKKNNKRNGSTRSR